MFVTSSYSTVKTGRFPCTWLDPAINPQITHKMAVIIKLSKNALITQNTTNKAVNTCHWHNTIFPVTGSISKYYLMRNGIALSNCISFTNKTTSTHFDGLSAILCSTMLFEENDILTNGCGLHLFNCKFWLIESHTIQNLYPCTKYLYCTYFQFQMCTTILRSLLHCKRCASKWEIERVMFTNLAPIGM